MSKIWDAVTDAVVVFVRAFERALWTALQSFIGALSANAFGITNLAVVEAAAIAGLSAGLAVLSVAARTRLGQLDG